jgi:hypothetical protein
VFADPARPMVASKQTLRVRRVTAEAGNDTGSRQNRTQTAYSGDGQP